MPTELKKLINTVRVFLSCPKLLLVHEKALHFGQDGFHENLKKFQEYLPHQLTTLLILKSFEKIDFFTNVIVLESGEITEKGQVQHLIKNEKSRLSETIKANDPNIYDKLFENMVEIIKAEREKMEDANIQETHRYADLELEDLDEHVEILDERLFNGN